MPVHKINMEEVDSLPDSIRGKGGFGSTGQW
jgi:dUTPase